MGLDARWMIDNIGSTTSPITSSTANSNFQGFYVANSDATGGTARGIYMRLYLTGAGQSGEAVRAFTTVNAAGAVGVHGIQASVSFGTSGTITGTAVGVRATFQVANATMSTGTAAALEADISSDGASSHFTGTTLSFLRLLASGNSTGATQMNTDAFFLDLNGGALTAGAGASNFINTSVTALTCYGSLRVKCPDGVTRYIPITTGS